MPGLEELEVADRQRARPDEAHLTAQDVQHLRYLVDRVAPQETADSGYARVVGDLEERSLSLVLGLELRLHGSGVGAHRPELEHPELLLGQPDTCVSVEHGAARVELDRGGDQKPERQSEDGDDTRHGEVERTLDHPVGADEDGRAQLEERHALARHVLAAPLDQRARWPAGRHAPSLPGGARARRCPRAHGRCNPSRSRSAR